MSSKPAAHPRVGPPGCHLLEVHHRPTPFLRHLRFGTSRSADRLYDVQCRGASHCRDTLWRELWGDALQLPSPDMPCHQQGQKTQVHIRLSSTTTKVVHSCRRIALICTTILRHDAAGQQQPRTALQQTTVRRRIWESAHLPPGCVELHQVPVAAQRRVLVLLEVVRQLGALSGRVVDQQCARRRHLLPRSPQGDHWGKCKAYILLRKQDAWLCGHVASTR